MIYWRLLGAQISEVFEKDAEEIVSLIHKNNRNFENLCFQQEDLLSTFVEEQQTDGLIESNLLWMENYYQVRL